jgi:hypothetical protein
VCLRLSGCACALPGVSRAVPPAGVVAPRQLPHRYRVATGIALCLVCWASRTDEAEAAGSPPRIEEQRVVGAASGLSPVDLKVTASSV